MWGKSSEDKRGSRSQKKLGNEREEDHAISGGNGLRI